MKVQPTSPRSRLGIALLFAVMALGLATRPAHAVQASASNPIVVSDQTLVIDQQITLTVRIVNTSTNEPTSTLLPEFVSQANERFCTPPSPRHCCQPSPTPAAAAVETENEHRMRARVERLSMDTSPNARQRGRAGQAEGVGAVARSARGPTGGAVVSFTSAPVKRRSSYLREST